MIQLTGRCTIYRMKQTPGQPAGKKSEQPVFTNVPCLIIPISDFDSLTEFARESSHLVYLPRWCRGVAKEDELRTDRRTDAQGVTAPWKYTVNGVRRYLTFGLRHVELFAKERD